MRIAVLVLDLRFSDEPTHPRRWVGSVGSSVRGFVLGSKVVRRSQAPPDARGRMQFPPGWHVKGERVSIAVKTEDFLDALDLFEEIGEVAEELEHHPDLHL